MRRRTLYNAISLHKTRDSLIKRRNELSMLNMALGPVMMSDEVAAIGAEQIPYFRTQEFSDILLENERIVLELAFAPRDSRAVFLTGSGTAAMESVVCSALSQEDRVLIVDGGSFGHRFVELCILYNIPHDVIRLEPGQELMEADLIPFQRARHTAFIVNICETSTGVQYDMELISRFCDEHNLLLIADAISAFLADEIDMGKQHIDFMILGSQKALACPPGISIVILSSRAIDCVKRHRSTGMYLDLRRALDNGERGQTPFTCAVGILRQLNARLKLIKEQGGADFEVHRCSILAEDFRKKIEGLPLQIAAERLSNAVTPLRPRMASAREVCEILKKDYGIWVCPNGGELSETVFRVGHIGALAKEDNDRLIAALRDMQRRGLL